MNKSELIDAIQNKTPDVSKAAIRDVINAYTAVIKETTTSGEEVSLTGFASYQIKARQARQARNPATGEMITVPASKSVVCALSKTWSKNI
mgnify:CR=1 FL=1